MPEMLNDKGVIVSELISRRETTILKGLAIGMIIIQHIGQAFQISAVNPLGPIGVFIFLFLSGYGIMCSYRKNGLKNYFSRRLIKVYFPYAVSVLLFLVFQLLTYGYIDDIKIIPMYFFLVELPQGSYWYLVLMFYWYIVFFFIAKTTGNLKVLIPLMIVATIMILILKEFNRNFVWQFATFPMGVIAGAYPKQLKVLFEKIRGLRTSLAMLLITLLLLVIKKTPYVDSHGLGLADTILQILITWFISAVLIIHVNRWSNLRFFTKVLLFAGSWSYILYLAHVLPLDYLKLNILLNNSQGWHIGIIYISTVLACIFVLKVVELLINRQKKSKIEIAYKKIGKHK